MAPENAFNLSPQKRELLARLLKEKGLATKQVTHIPPRPDDAPPPLSFAQERLWYLEKLMPGKAAYNIPLAFLLSGQLNVTALHQSINYVIQRHEVLRTIFDLDSSAPNQTITEHTSLPFPIEILSTESDIEAEIKAEAQRPFNLQSGPLLRAKLLKLDPSHHYLLLTIHHIVADGWSLAIFFRELSACYAALEYGPAADLPEVPVQYADFAHWQRQRLSGDLLDSQMSYWRQQLGGERPDLNLPLDKHRPTTPSFRGEWFPFSITAELLAGLKSLARSEDTTLFVLLLAAYKTLLNRYSGQDEILVGSPVTNRIHPELENVIGHFINTLVLRTDFSESVSFRDLLEQQRQVVLAAYSNQDIPLEYILEAVQPARDPSKNPLFQSVFILQDVPAKANWRTALNLPGVQTEQMLTHSQTAKADLTLEAEEIPEGLALSFEYNTDIFTAETINNMADHFITLLEGVVANPNRQLTDYALITAEVQSIIKKWNDTASEFPVDHCVHTLFEDQVAISPDAPALIQDERQLTYAELNTKANRIAHHLQSIGVGPDVPVGVYAKRSFAFITGLLAILKAGGAYVPLDINLPQDRLAYLLDNANASALLIEAEQVGNFTFNTGPTIVIDEDEATTLATSTDDQNLPLQTRSDNLAYIMYTSGSTGQPKGVGIPHFAINRLVCNTNYTTFEPDDIIGHLSSVAFDAATFEIWGALLNGIPVAVIPREIALVPEMLESFIEMHKVSCVFITTSLFNHLAYNRPQIFSRLRVLMFGGEACDPQAVKLVREGHSPQELLHVYGPTESTTYVSWYPVKAVVEGVGTVPIGYPLANTTLHILDKHLNPMPNGIPGELYVGGMGLSRGYFKLPGLTANAFRPDPFSQAPGMRLYKTGDLVRMVPDPNDSSQLVIEFIGRIDNQIKLRGFRIELSEIETVLRQFSAVQESVVLARKDVPNNIRLVAYLIVQDRKTFSQIELRRHLQTHLPDYMIPAAIIILESMPVTTNGKVDWRALPAPSMERPQIESQYVAPQSNTEQTIALIWQEVLHLQQVGRYDNFFDLGGNSLLLVKVHDRLQQTFDRKIPIVQLFTHSTIGDLTKYLDQSPGKEPAKSAVISASLERGQKRRLRRRRRST